MKSSMLETKFYLPRSRPGALPRTRLMDMLDRGMSAKLTLVSAPAGFGKTTLLAQWLQRRAQLAHGGPSVAWVSLDAGDSEPRLYWSYVVTALQTAAPQVGEQELVLLQAADPPPVQQLLITLLNDLAALPTDVMLVLDDYHVIESREVHEAMAFLLENAPPRLHLLITSRADPAVPLARLRARGELVEVRATDLRFTPDEAASYLSDAMGLTLTAGEITKLEHRTEGWIAALQLAALSIQKREDVAAFVESFTGDDRYIVDYLVEEVLRHQPAHVQTFLSRTSVLDRLNGPLCDALTEQGGGKATLESLDRANLFIVPLDSNRRWYRYHHLFADVLRARLHDEDPELVRELHRRASGWHESHGERAEAIRHSLVAADFERAAELVEREVPVTRRQRRERALLRWLEALPHEVFRSRPVLSVAYAGTLLSTGTVDGVEQRLLDAERWLTTAKTTDPASAGASKKAAVDESELRQVPAWVAIYRAALALIQGDPLATAAHARRALTFLEDVDQFASAAASALLGLASWGQGDLEAAHEAYARCSLLFRQTGHVSDVLACAITLAAIETTQGRLGQAMSTYEQALRLAVQQQATQGAALRGTADMHVGMSEVHLERDDLRAARHCLQLSRELGEHNGLPQNRYRWRVAMAHVREAEGDLDAAAELLDEAERTYVGDFAPDVRAVSALKACVRIKQGQLDEAFSWANQQVLSVDDELSYLREFEHLTLARMLLARFGSERRQQDLEDADRLLERLLDTADKGRRTGSALKVLVLQALARQLRGDIAAALVPLKRALELAAPERYARVFLDEGPPMTALLRAAGAAKIEPAYVNGLLGARQGVPPVELHSSTAGASLIEPLSERERQVLRLLATDLGGPDIARELVVSLSTVRTHTRSIYAKLDVTSRRAAVRRADELDLLRATRP